MEPGDSGRRRDRGGVLPGLPGRQQRAAARALQAGAHLLAEHLGGKRVAGLAGLHPHEEHALFDGAGLGDLAGAQMEGALQDGHAVGDITGAREGMGDEGDGGGDVHAFGAGGGGEGGGGVAGVQQVGVQRADIRLEGFIAGLGQRQGAHALPDFAEGGLMGGAVGPGGERVDDIAAAHDVIASISL